MLNGARASLPALSAQRELPHGVGLSLFTMGDDILITCFLRYTIAPGKLEAFEHYARVWMQLIEKYGGTHQGYFAPDDEPPSAAFSFPASANPARKTSRWHSSTFRQSRPTTATVAKSKTTPNAKPRHFTTNRQSASPNTSEPSCGGLKDDPEHDR